ncbi:hypothetical protein NT6N_21620 [Oceaniferula spumae]|uniref:DUF5069 domain-containing protein n=1 Tax=Oceaniferula spumae TaxID=2979115 RepID=A0AAT9FMD0_9BACT
MINLRSPYDRSVADTMFWARLIDKVRLYQDGDLPEDYSGVLGHKLGTDGQFLGHFGLSFDQVTEAVPGKDDTALATWLEEVVDDFPAKRDSWNELAPELGKDGTAMERGFKYAIRKYFPDTDPPAGVDTIFGLIEFDESRA